MTLKTLLLESVARHPHAVFLRYRKNGQWREVTYDAFLTRVKQAAAALAALGVGPGDRVALMRENAPDWAETYFGIIGLGAVAVPIDAKLKEQEVLHILRDAGAAVLVAGVNLYPLIDAIGSRLPGLEQVLLVGGSEVLPNESEHTRYADYEEALSNAAGGSEPAFDRHDPDPEDLASLIYTSGTMGQQKGAMLSHRNFRANVASCRGAAEIMESDNFLLVLPLHHAFAFTTNLLLPLAAGAQISFVESLKTIGENIRAVSPTILIAVPLLLEKMYARVAAALAANRLGHTLFRLGVRGAVRRKVAASLGGRLRMVITGGAACPPDVIQGFSALGIPVAEGYGLTETGPVLSLNPFDRPKPGTVGKALPDVELSIHEPNAEGVGEVITRGPNVMRGYYRAEQATAEAFRDGWFLTGDLGTLDEEGYLTITGRKKNLIVNREGKNIYPEEIEAVLHDAPLVLEALAVGYGNAWDTGGEKVGVVVVADQAAIDDLAARENRRFTDAEIAERVIEDVKKATRVLADFKRPRRIRIRSEEFLKTSTGKVKRYLYGMEGD
jgi:long-chain acyl-CoA synthetase